MLSITSLTQPLAPNVARQQDLDRRGERNGEKRTEQTADEQSPDEDGNDHSHRMETDGVTDDARRVEETLQHFARR